MTLVSPKARAVAQASAMIPQPMLAKALENLLEEPEAAGHALTGDRIGTGHQILQSYSHDLRGHFARYTQALLAKKNTTLSASDLPDHMTIEDRIQHLLSQMTLREKIGQMIQTHDTSEASKELVRQGLVGSIFNELEVAKVAEFQHASIHESRLGIPLIIGRDVIHGYHTIFPIPLGQAASWNTDLVEKAARTAAREVSSTGVHWTFSPMVDIARDPRWGRIAEGAGEDPILAGAMGAAMVRGYQGDDLSQPDSIAACAKHFVGYGATEGGRDYNTADIPERTLRDVYLKPFKACVDAGVCTLMSGFNEIDGIPASGNAFTLRQVLRDEWKFDGFVVSDWTSIQEMIVHGFCADGREAAREGVLAGVSMEMESKCYLDHLESLVSSGEIPLACVDDAVRSILRIKFRLGLFENAMPPLPQAPFEARTEDLDLARQLARESCVLLKNDNSVLPLRKGIGSLAVIGALADSPLDQIGCWAFDRHLPDIRTPLAAIRDAVGESTEVHYVRAFSDESTPQLETDDAALQAQLHPKPQFYSWAKASDSAANLTAGRSSISRNITSHW